MAVLVSNVGQPLSTIMKTKSLTFAVLTSLCLVLSQSAYAALFIKFDGVDGEAKDADHRGWSDADSVDMSVSKEIDPATGEPTGKVKVDKFCLTKPIDKSSPLLMKAAVGADETYPAVTIEFTRDVGPDGPECKVYMKYEMKEVTVISYKSNVDRVNPPGTEEICLSFRSLTVTYIPCSEDGTPGDPVVTTYTRD